MKPWSEEEKLKKIDDTKVSQDQVVVLLLFFSIEFCDYFGSILMVVHFDDTLLETTLTRITTTNGGNTL